jgi:hypothetical protein
VLSGTGLWQVPIDTDMVGHHDRASTLDAASGIYSRS